MSGDIESVEVRSGVNEEGEGFCHLIVQIDGRLHMGQLPPALMRSMAMDWLQAAEAAEQDAAVFRCIRKLQLPDEMAGAVIAEMRDSRDS